MQDDSTTEPEAGDATETNVETPGGTEVTENTPADGAGGDSPDGDATPDGGDAGEGSGDAD